MKVRIVVDMEVGDKTHPGVLDRIRSDVEAVVKNCQTKVELETT